MNTTVAQKKKYWPEFIKACESQWQTAGAERYKLNKDMEFTDLIYMADQRFVGSQIMKHTGELLNTNPKPEVGFFKIAVWAFIWWLKEKENLTQRDKGEEFDNEIRQEQAGSIS